MQANENIHSFDAILDAQFGKPGTSERENFEREAEAYCIGQLIHDA